MEKEKNRKFICMFIIGYLGYSVIYVARLNFSTAATLFEQLGTLDKTQISLIMASVMDVLTYGGAGIGTLCFGVLIQHFGYSSMFAVWIVISTISAGLLYTWQKKIAYCGRVC